MGLLNKTLLIRTLSCYYTGELGMILWIMIPQNWFWYAARVLFYWWIKTCFESVRKINFPFENIAENKIGTFVMIACFRGYIELTDFFKIFEWKDILIWNHANWTHIRREIFWNVRSTSKLSSACKYSRESNFKRGIGTSSLTGLSTIKPKTACPQPVKYIQKNEVVHEQRLPKACNCWITSPNEINKIILLNAVKIFIANATPTTTVGICFRFQSEKTQNVATSHLHQI